MANATAKPCPRCFALIPLALHAGHAHWHRELEASVDHAAAVPAGERPEGSRA